MSEFDLIRRHFAHSGAIRGDVTLGVGDDCALLRVPAGVELAVSIDTLVAGVHFLPDCDPEGLGHKCLAVGLSDLASMGAEPAWATLALTIPEAEEGWLSALGRGFASLAQAQGVQLVGGDTTRGALTVTVQVHGFVPAGQGMRRSGAQPQDLVCVSGELGDAGLALQLLQSGQDVSQTLRRHLERPIPRVELGLGLRGLATSMIDVSDGLVADLGHILEASGCGAEIVLGDLPLSSDVAQWVRESGDWAVPAASGDDYELCFTIPSVRRGELDALGRRCGVELNSIGHVTRRAGLHCLLSDGSTWEAGQGGYDHFSDDG